MSELSQEARALIDSVSTLDDPTDDDRTRIRKRLALQLGASAFSAAAVTNVGGVTSKAVAASKSGLFGVAGKAALCAGALCAVAGTIWLLDWQGGEQSRPSAPTQVSAQQQLAVSEPESAPSAPASQAPAPVSEVQAEPTAKPGEPLRARRKPVNAQQATSEPKPAVANSLAAELALLGRAQAALRAGQPAQALALAGEHERQYPAGVLKEERLGVAALAECTLSPSGTQRAHAQAFLAAAPSSPLAARVRKACGLE